MRRASTKPTKKKADGKYPPDHGDEPIDADEEWEEREQKGRVKPKRQKEPDGSPQD